MNRHISAFLARLLCVLVLLSAAPALAANCAPATSGGTAPASWPTYCWIDFDGYVDATAKSAAGQDFSVLLTDGATLSFNVKAAGVAIGPIIAPSWTGAAVGNTAFLGIPGKPVLYTSVGGTVTLTISGIVITPPSGVTAVTSYAVVAADAESTNETESLTFETNGTNWTVLDQVNPISGNVYPGINNAGSVFTTTGVPGVVGGYIIGSGNPTTVKATIVGGGLQGVMFAVRFATISLTKQIVSSRLDPADQFDYRITTTSSGAVLASGVTSGASNGPFNAAAVSFASGLPVTISESMVPGSVNPLSNYRGKLTCINSTVGSTTPLPVNVTSTSYSFGALQFGDGIVCTYSNTPVPRLRVVKALRGTRLADSDQFTVAITSGATTLASTTTSGAGGVVTNGATPKTLALPGTSYSFSETAAGTTVLSNYNASIVCTNAYNGSKTPLPTSVGGNVTPNYGDDITCTITNAGAPRLRIAKALDGSRRAAGDQFTVTISNGATVLASTTTTGSGATITNGTTTSFVGIAGTAYSFGEQAAGTTVLSNYGASLVCSNTLAGSATALTTLVPGVITPTWGDNILCTLTNSTVPRLSLIKIIGAPRVNNTDQFTIRISIGTTNVATATTTGTGAVVTNGTIAPITVTAGTTYTLNEIAAGGTTLANYVSTLACTNTASGSPTVLPNTVGGTVTPRAGDAINCIMTNTPRPRLRLAKALGGARLASTDQFVMQIAQGATIVGTATTTGTANTVTNGQTSVVFATAGLGYVFRENASGTTTLTNYTATLACTNGFTGSPTPMPTSVPATITPVLGDNINCIMTNTPRSANAVLSISKASTVISDPFNGTINPKAIPGAFVRYFITVTNTGRGAVDAGTVVITDPLPANVSVFASTGSGDPVQFIDGSVASGLSYTYASTVSFSNALGGSGPFTHTPILDGAGFSSSATGIRIAPTGTMAAATVSGPPSFTVQFLVRVN